MKKLQRILAILGVVLLLALYASTMIYCSNDHRPGIIVCLHDDLPLSEKPKQIK